METYATSDSRLRQVDLSLWAEESFDVPLSDGYSVYSALLSVLQSSDEDASARVHDSAIGSLRNSGLSGPFGSGKRSYHKLLRANTEYDLSLGITDPEDETIFQALVSALVLDDRSIELSHGTLHVDSFESDNATHEALLNTAAGFADPSIEMTFQTATCIEEVGSVTTMFPTRTAVFSSLLGKWNNTAPQELQLDLDRETLAASVIEKPDDRSYQTHSVLVNRVDSADGNPQAIFKQGFSGTCEYAFKDASDSVQNAVTALALFGEYSGVGSAIARGCGSIEVIINEQE